MPIHVPAPTQPTNKCPKCGTEGVVEQTIGNMATFVCPKCGARWVAARDPAVPTGRAMSRRIAARPLASLDERREFRE